MFKDFPYWKMLFYFLGFFLASLASQPIPYLQATTIPETLQQIYRFAFHRHTIFIFFFFTAYFCFVFNSQ